MAHSGELRDKVTIVTGASTGIGRALALELAGAGAKLVLAARDEAALARVAAECAARGARALVRRTDVTRAADCAALVDLAVGELGRLDVLVNNAGMSMSARFDALADLSVFEQLMQVNFLGAARLTQLALPHLVASRGRLVAVASVAGVAGVPTRTGYAASKHALVGFCDSLRIELAGSGVTVTVVVPDFVQSEIRERAFGPDGKPLGRGNSPVQEQAVMSAETCARLVSRAIARRDRQALLSRRVRLGLWLRLLAPALTDRIAARAVRRGR
jgi:short-subunit dehydrogenase